MITKIETSFRYIGRIFNRSEWAIRLLRLQKLKQDTGEPGLVMVQIDGLSLTQFSRALHKKRIPFLNSLLHHERYALHGFYSGLPSNTPAVQSELFYGVKGCVPAFNFIDRSTGEIVKMMDPAYVEKFEERLKAQGSPGLLTGGSSYSNIYTGGAAEAHFCWAQLGWGGVLHAANPLILPFLFLLYIDIFIRTAILLVIEFCIALPECIRGTLKGRSFYEELRFVWLRVLICVMLREIIVAGVCIDIMRGLPIIHMNFLGYDEQAHCRGPESRYAHWSLHGIDNAIKRIHKVMRQSPNREYDLWVYGDHGQETTTPYPVKYGLTIQEAVENLFGKTQTPKHSLASDNRILRHGRAGLFKNKSHADFKKEPKADGTAIDFKERESIVTAMGPLGQIYVKKNFTREEIESYAQRLVSEVKIPLVLTRQDSQKVLAWTPRGSFVLPDQIAEVFGADHPFLEEFKEDIIRMCYHPDAGEFIIAGWCQGESPMSLSLEYGAHAAMGPEETKSFALFPADISFKSRRRPYLRPTDLREAAQRFLQKESFSLFSDEEEESVARPLRFMSYNVHGCRGVDGYVSMQRISRVIARNNPDVVALQELDVGRTRSRGMDQVGRIARILGMKYHFHPASRWGDEQYGNAILSRYPLNLIKMESLPRAAENRLYEPRGAMWVTIDYHGTPIQVINTHLSIWPKERLLQINALLGREWLGHPDCRGPVVLCGDFNSSPGSTVYKRIIGKLQDSQSILAGHRPRRTLYGRYPLSQIDYIFVTSEFKVAAITVPRTALDQVASDHLPLSVDLNFIEDHLKPTVGTED